MQTWFAKKGSGATPPSPRKDRSGIRVGIPKVLNIWNTHQFWVGFLRDIGISSENIVFSSDTSEEQGREWSKVPLSLGWERVIVNNSCPKGLVEDLNEMKVIKAGIEKTKNAFPNIADMVRQEGFRRNTVSA